MRPMRSMLIAFIILSVLLFSCDRMSQAGRDEAVEVDTMFGDGESLEVGGLRDPTSVGMVHMMENYCTSGKISFSVYDSLRDLKDRLISGQLDIAAVPTGVAAQVYNETDGAYLVAAVNTLGVTTVLEKGNDIKELKDLKGRRLAALGKGFGAEATFRVMLRKAGLDPDMDVEIEWMDKSSDIVEWLSKRGNDLAMVAEPSATVITSKRPDVRVALDLGDQWRKVKVPGDFIAAVLIVKKSLVDRKKAGFLNFLEEYKDSIYYAKFSREASSLVVKYGIVVEEKIAKMALPSIELVFMDGEEMKKEVSTYLSVLHDENPVFIGGSIPEEDFYFLP